MAVAIDMPQGDEEEEGAYTVEIDGTTADGKEDTPAVRSAGQPHRFGDKPVR